jgi:hypothetical protein
MNAGGVLNTCKLRGDLKKFSDGKGEQQRTGE